jgi:hypothetical protein
MAAVLAYAVCLLSGCAVLAQKEAVGIEQRHGVNLEIEPTAAVADLYGGSSIVSVKNIDKELSAFPDEAKRDLTIHVGTNLDILGQSRSIGDALASPLAIAAVQEHAGDTQGDIFVTNRGIVGTYFDLFEPNSIGWQDPRLRHELMHSYEIRALKGALFSGKTQAALEDAGEMKHKMQVIDRLSLPAREADIATDEFKPYLRFCARWLASMFGDVNGDRKVDERDIVLLRADTSRFDVNKDGKLDYDDGAMFLGTGYSYLDGIHPATQAQMTAGLFGLRPRGFASYYGRTGPWEDKAEALELAVRKGFIPYFYKRGEPEKVERAYRFLADIRNTDAVFARKLEAMGILFGNLERSENRNERFRRLYRKLMLPISRPAASP